MDVSDYTDGDIDKLLRDQAVVLFKQCDRDNKSYITRDDLRILSQELDLSTELVDEAFDKLDINKNEYLTLREFINGFGLFLGIESESNDLEEISEESLKAIELFNLCDIDQKGYVTKYDLNRLTSELGLSDQQVNDIFHQLDEDNNGFISLNEFIYGFSSFIVQDDPPTPNKDKRLSTLDNNNDNVFDEKYFTNSWSKQNLSRTLSNKNNKNRYERGTLNSDSSISERNFIKRQMSVRYESGNYGADEVIEKLNEEVGGTISKEHLQEMWDTVSTTSNHMTAKMFENFLERVYSELKSARQETKHLESVLEQKSEKHNEEIKRIYDEMEIQVQTEKLRQKELVALRENSLREDLYREMAEKENQLEKLMQRQINLENRLLEVKEEEKQLKFQNNKLLQENSQLEGRLNDSMSDLYAMKSNLQTLEQQTTQEKKETLRAAVQATQNINAEHENLIRQLDILRNMNQKLRDDRDTIEASLNSKVVRLQSVNDEIKTYEKESLSRKGSNMEKYLQGSSMQRTTSTPRHSPLTKQGSIMSNYFETMGDFNQGNMFDGVPEGDESALDSIVEQDESCVSPTSDKHNDVFEQSLITDDSNVVTMDSLRASELADSGDKLSMKMETPSSPRRPPVGMNEEDLHSNADTMSEAASTSLPPENPNRVYKIVFVGDSGVGKSSFIYRFCFDDFRPNFSATIGVDFQVKTIQVNRQWTALQLWDTAGQERFRSITKQYFRRADGVVVMFDVMTESTFVNVKQWMLNVEEGAEPDCVVMLIGSKADLAGPDGALRKVKVDAAKKLAKDFDASYMEVSALSGAGVTEAMEKLAKKMSTNEDNLLKHSVLNLDISKDAEPKKKKGCC